MVTEGFASPRTSRQRLFPNARLGSCWLHAVRKLPGKLTALSSEVRQGLSQQCATLLAGSRARKSLRVFALGQQWRRGVRTVRRKAGETNGDRVRRWRQDQKAGW
jgi:hypothetical protein